MNITLPTRLLLADALLGNIVSETMGEDLDIIRYDNKSKALSVRFGSKYSYTYSTIASFHGTVLGGACVYLSKEDRDSYKLTQGRMKRTLQSFGYRIISSNYDIQTCNLVRVIGSPLIDSSILIVETLKLHNIEHVFLFQHQRILSEVHNFTDTASIKLG